MVRFQCPRCNKQLKAPEDWGGRRTKCPQCGNPVVVPLPNTQTIQQPTAAESGGELDPNAVARGQASQEPLGKLRCPQCGFSYGYDGKSCSHCGGRGTSTPATLQPPIVSEEEEDSGGDPNDTPPRLIDDMKSGVVLGALLFSPISCMCVGGLGKGADLTIFVCTVIGAALGSGVGFILWQSRSREYWRTKPYRDRQWRQERKRIRGKVNAMMDQQDLERRCPVCQKEGAREVVSVEKIGEQYHPTGNAYRLRFHFRCRYCHSPCVPAFKDTGLRPTDDHLQTAIMMQRDHEGTDIPGKVMRACNG